MLQRYGVVHHERLQLLLGRVQSAKLRGHECIWALVRWHSRVSVRLLYHDAFDVCEQPAAAESAAESTAAEPATTESAAAEPSAVASTASTAAISEPSAESAAAKPATSEPSAA